MVLDEAQILELIETPYNQYIKDCRENHKVLDIYLNGGDVAGQLEKVKNYENEDQKELREKIARSTKDLLGYLLNPLNKIFSAGGFNEELEFKVKSSQEQCSEHLKRLPEGMSMRKWIRRYWQEAFITDPNGVLLVEVEEIDDKVRAYPTYKSVNVIHDYRLTWDKFEYIILLHKKVKIGESDKQIYRVYDEEKDALYYVEDGKLIEYDNPEEGDDHIFMHNYGYVPAVLPSDLINKKTGGKKSFIEKIDEILKEYMRDSSVHSIFKFLFGFPIFWAYSMKCTTCDGTGKVKNERYTEGGTEPYQKKCPTCKGTTLQVTRDVSNGVRLPLPQSSEDPKIAPHIAGFVQPDLDTWQKQLDELQSMKSDMFYALYGTQIVEDQTSEKTATEVYINKQPIIDTLNDIADTAQSKENALVEYMAKAMFPESFEKANIKYGRRYLIETPDILWEKYITAKEKQAPISTLDYLYRQFLMAEYHNDLNLMEQKVKEFELEPYVHYSLSDLKDVASSEQIQKKILFSDWVHDADFDKDIKVLEKEFEEYVKLNMKIDESSTESKD